MEPEFSISFWGLGHVTPNLVYLAKSAKCRVYFLRHGLSNTDELWYMSKGRWVVHGGINLTKIQGQDRGHGGYEMWPYAISRLRQGLELIEDFNVMSPHVRQDLQWPLWYSHELADHFVRNPFLEVMTQFLIYQLLIESSGENCGYRSDIPQRLNSHYTLKLLSELPVWQCSV